MKICPKCSYIRKATDQAVPDWQCPSCGIAYVKFAAQPGPPAAPRVQTVMLSTAPAAPMSAKTLLLILAVVALGWFGYDRFYSAKAQDRNMSGGGETFETSNPAFYGTIEPGGPVLRMKPETSAALAKLTPSRVMMFATSWCPYCAGTRKLFAREGVRYTELDIEDDSAAASFQKNVMGMSGVPTIVIGNRVIRGFNERAILAALKEL